MHTITYSFHNLTQSLLIKGTAVHHPLWRVLAFYRKLSTSKFFHPFKYPIRYPNVISQEISKLRDCVWRFPTTLKFDKYLGSTSADRLSTVQNVICIWSCTMINIMCNIRTFLITPFGHDDSINWIPGVTATSPPEPQRLASRALPIKVTSHERHGASYNWPALRLPTKKT